MPLIVTRSVTVGTRNPAGTTNLHVPTFFEVHPEAPPLSRRESRWDTPFPDPKPEVI